MPGLYVDWARSEPTTIDRREVPDGHVPVEDPNVDGAEEDGYAGQRRVVSEPPAVVHPLQDQLAAVPPISRRPSRIDQSERMARRSVAASGSGPRDRGMADPVPGAKNGEGSAFAAA